MTKKPEKESKPTTFVASLDTSLADRLLADLKKQGFVISTPAHTLFSAKKKGLVCTFYSSGKLTIQGKNSAEFIEFYLEPEILQRFPFTYQELNIDQSPRIGIDESGKGDFFGPLCIAGVFASGQDVPKLRTLGVRDSKTLTDNTIRKVAKKIKDNYAHHIVKINPAKYNELYSQFQNLNSLLAWGHATTIETLINQTGCSNIIIDQFASKWVVETALKRKKMKANLTQRHRGEEDLVVAAASILARETFLEGLKQLSEQYGLPLPKGASQSTIKVGRQFLKKHGQHALTNVCKTHFKTLDAIMDKMDNGPEWT